MIKLKLDRVSKEVVDYLTTYDNNHFSKRSNHSINSKVSDTQRLPLDLTQIEFTDLHETFEDTVDRHEFEATPSNLINIFVYFQLIINGHEPALRHTYPSTFNAEMLKSLKWLNVQSHERIWNFVRHLDAYTAVKCIENFATNPEILAIFDVADEEGWDIHFDHMAIRCGTDSNNDSKFVSESLKQYGYQPSQLTTQQQYVFSTGWSAYPMYKLLRNGEVLRVFVDQSDKPAQIIHLWNKAYGFTCHHMAMRATKKVDCIRHAIPLSELTEKLNAKGVETMPPTGAATNGLLEQLFTKPQINDNLPQDLLDEAKAIDETFPAKLKNGKLIELVSRKELPVTMAETLMNAYDVNYLSQSCPIYPYFLPEQAEHVIATSQET